MAFVLVVWLSPSAPAPELVKGEAEPRCAGLVEHLNIPERRSTNNTHEVEVRAPRALDSCVSDGRWAQTGTVERRWYDPRLKRMTSETNGSCPSAEAWQWQPPENCSLPHWNATRFCELLGPRGRVSLIGDSLNSYWGETLIRQLRQSRFCAKVSVGRFFTKYLQTDCVTEPGTKCQRSENHFYRWLNPKVLGETDVAIFNSGAHFVNTDAQYIRYMCQAATVARRLLRPGAIVVYRNTPFGHSNCHQHFKPFASVSEAEAYSDAKPFFHGRFFKRRNHLAEAIWARHGAIVMDAYSPTVQRPDYHFARCKSMRAVTRRDAQGREVKQERCTVYDCLVRCICRARGGPYASLIFPPSYASTTASAQGPTSTGAGCSWPLSNRIPRCALLRANSLRPPHGHPARQAGRGTTPS